MSGGTNLWNKTAVRILYRVPAFEGFDYFSDFVESINYGTSETCQERGSNPCRGARALLSIVYLHIKRFRVQNRVQK